MSFVNIGVRNTPVVNQYYLATFTTTGTVTCDEETDNKNNYANVLCLSDGDFEDSKKVDCGTGGICNYGTCGEMTEDLCTEATDMYDVSAPATPVFLRTCVTGGAGSTCQDMTIVDIARPDNDTDRSATEINKWYVGDSTYVTGYSYTCSASKDNVGGADTPYLNGMCLNDGGDGIDESKTIYCNGVSKVGFTATTNDVNADCTLTECGTVNSDWCADGFDLYKLEGSSVVYSDTCVQDTDETNAFCVSISSAMSTTVGIVAGFIVMAGLL